uniref:Reverse transcriptase Ty1/copia-type domain-containing protein n=1 Tax=Solanum lycopersicum TaxID=4081 RepID=A0A3Q7GG86_SOLLC
MANMTGMVHTPRSKVSKLKWTIDTGTTNHMISILDVLHDMKIFKTEQNMKVYLPNGGITLVTHTDLGLGSVKPAWSPLEANVKLTELDCLTGDCDDEPFEDKEQYQRLVGKMLYLTMTRPDIAYSVQTLNTLEAAVRVMKYIKREPGLGILLSSRQSNKLSVYSDADWTSCPNTRRSVSGFLIKHVSRSSTEADYRSMANAVSELVWIIAILKELGNEIDQPDVYLAITCPDIQFAVNRVAQRMHQPSEHDNHCLKRILRYIFGTLGRGLLIRPGDLELRGFSDSDWANDKNDRKSTSGFLIFLGRT